MIRVVEGWGQNGKTAAKTRKAKAEYACKNECTIARCLVDNRHSLNLAFKKSPKTYLLYLEAAKRTFAKDAIVSENLNLMWSRV